MQSARYQEFHRADRCNSDNLTRKQREYYREKQRMKRRKEKRRRRIRSIVSSLEGIFLCLVLPSCTMCLCLAAREWQETFPEH